MKIKKPNKVWGWFKLPETQFFLIFITLFTGTFIINYLYLPEKLKAVSIIVYISATFIVLMEGIYSAYVHHRVEQEEQSFIRVTAHQMRTPLTAIKWVLGELERQDLSEAEKKEMLRMTGLASEKLTNIINDFSDMAQLEGGSQLNYEFENLDLTTFINQIVSESELVSKQYGVSVEFQGSLQKVEAYADPVKMNVVFANLINNAIKYNKKGGSVIIRMRQLESEPLIEVVVEDTGEGISAEDQKKLFTKFFRSEKAKEINPTGTGLGLYIVKSIILRHGGNISVQSILGRGTTFRFTLPIKE